MRKVSWALISVASIMFLGCAKEVEVGEKAYAPAAPGILMIADFNAGEAPNILGGDFGAWDKDPEDETQSAEILFNDEVVDGDSLYALEIRYDVDSPNPAFNGIWMKLEDADFSSYENLVFLMKGDSQAGFTEELKLEMKNSRGDSGTYMLSGITDQWQEISVPLQSFRGLRDFSGMDELVIVFEDAVATQKEGVIYIDNIYVE